MGAIWKIATMMRGPVFVGTDLSPKADEALRQGHQLARDRDSALIVCHVVPEILSARVLFPRWVGIDPALHEAITAKAQTAVADSYARSWVPIPTAVRLLRVTLGSLSNINNARPFTLSCAVSV